MIRSPSPSPVTSSIHTSSPQISSACAPVILSQRLEKPAVSTVPPMVPSPNTRAGFARAVSSQRRGHHAGEGRVRKSVPVAVVATADRHPPDPAPDRTVHTSQAGGTVGEVDQTPHRLGLREQAAREQAGHREGTSHADPQHESHGRSSALGKHLHAQVQMFNFRKFVRSRTRSRGGIENRSRRARNIRRSVSDFLNHCLSMACSACLRASMNFPPHRVGDWHAFCSQKPRTKKLPQSERISIRPPAVFPRIGANP